MWLKYRQNTHCCPGSHAWTWTCWCEECEACFHPLLWREKSGRTVVIGRGRTTTYVCHMAHTGELFISCCMWSEYTAGVCLLMFEMSKEAFHTTNYLNKQFPPIYFSLISFMVVNIILMFHTISITYAVPVFKLLIEDDIWVKYFKPSVFLLLLQSNGNILEISCNILLP